MTDKQIIDVSNCIYHNNGKCTNSEIGQCNCANVASCYYKEYKRKEQECEELKDKLNCRFCYPIMKIDDPENFKLCQETDCFRRQLDRLKKENEELKKELESTKGLVTVGNKQLEECLLELQKYKDKEQREIELKKQCADSFKEMQKRLYGKFVGSSLIEKRSPYDN